MLENAHGSQLLSTRTIRQIAEELTRPKSVFTLQVSDGANEKVAYFSGGGLRLLSVGPRRCHEIESFLLKSRRIGVDDLHRALETSRKDNTSLRDSLSKLKLMSGEEFSAIVKRLIIDELRDLVFWHDAFFTCSTGAPPKEIYDLDKKALTASLEYTWVASELEEWSRAWDRSRGRFHSDAATITVTSTGRFGLEQTRDDTRQCLEIALRSPTIRDLYMQSTLEWNRLLDVLNELHEKEWISVERPGADDSAGGLAVAIAELESVLPRVIGKDLVRDKLVVYYRRAGRDADANALLAEMASSALRASQWPLAVERLKQILAQEPSHLPALEQALRIYIDQNLHAEANSLAYETSDKLMSRRQLDEARQVAKTLSRFTGSNLDAQGILAQVAARSGDESAAVEQYIKLAQDYELASDKKQAIRVVKQALNVIPGNERLLTFLGTLDPSSADAIREKLRRSGAAAEESRSTSRGGARALILVAGLALLALAALYVSGNLSFGLADASGEGEDESTGPTHSSGPGPIETLFGVDTPVEGKAGMSVAEATERIGTLTSASRGESGRSASSGASFPRGVGPVDDGSAAGAMGQDEATATPYREGPTLERGSSPIGVAPVRSERSTSTPGDPSIESATSRAANGEDWEPTAPEVEPNPAHRSDSNGEPPRHGLDLLPHQLDADWSPGSANAAILTPAVRSRAQAAVGSTEATVEIADVDLVIAYATSLPLVGLHPSTGQVLFEVPRREECRWSVGHRALSIARWRPGDRWLLYQRLNHRQRTMGRLAPGTAALVVGSSRIATRMGRMTVIEDLTGNALHRGELPLWSHGAFVNDLLLLSRTRSDADGPAGIWALHSGTWQPLWAITAQDGRWNIR